MHGINTPRMEKQSCSVLFLGSKTRFLAEMRVLLLSTISSFFVWIGIVSTSSSAFTTTTTTTTPRVRCSGPIHILQPNSVPKSRLRLRLFHSDSLEKLLFGYLDAVDTTCTPPEDPQKELARFDSLATSRLISEALQAHDSLTAYLYLWAVQNLEQSQTTHGGGGGGIAAQRPLTTPITASDFVHTHRPASNENTRDDDDDDDDEQIAAELYSSMRLMFRPPKRYLSYKEQKGLDKGVIPDRKGAKLDAWSPGGVEIIVQTTVHGERNVKDDDDEGYQMHLFAKRCGIDGDTVIKVSSERALVRRLEEAVRIWRKVREFRK